MGRHSVIVTTVGCLLYIYISISSGNQIGFKRQLGTDVCIHVLKEIVGNYKCLNGTICSYGSLILPTPLIE